MTRKFHHSCYSNLLLLTCCVMLRGTHPTYIGVTNHLGLPKTEGPPETQMQSGKVLVKLGWDGHHTHLTYSRPQWGTPSLPPAPHDQKCDDYSYACPLRTCAIDTLNLTQHRHAMVYTPTTGARGFLFLPSSSTPGVTQLSDVHQSNRYLILVLMIPLKFLLVNCLFIFSALFFPPIGIAIFFLLIYKSSLYVLDSNPLLV